MKAIHTNDAPQAVGPYSQAIMQGNTLYISGQLGIDPETSDLKEDFEEQAEQVFANLNAILRTAELSFDNVVKVSVFLTDIKEFGLLNSIYAKYFTEPYPAREAFQVSALPKGGLVEISLIAMR